MKRILTLILMVSLISSLVTGCETKEQSGTAIGAGTGALIGSRFGRGDGRILGAIGGALLGGFIGNRIGANMDEKDRTNMRNAAINTPMDHQAQWTNSNTGATYVVTPTRQYHASGQYCREYQTTVTVNGEQQKAYGKACRQPDGSWKMMNS